MSQYLLPSVVIFLSIAALADGFPDWAKGRSTLKREGNVLTALCIGNGISLDLAREKAQDSCQRAALSQLPTSSISVRVESIQSERDSTFHEEVKESYQVRNLKCDPERESIDTNADGFIVYLSCRFDLGRALVTDEVEKRQLVPPSTSPIRNEANLSEPTTSDAKRPGTIKRSSSRLVSVSAVPACDSIIVRGKRPSRVVRCDSNPQILQIDFSVDQELVVRPQTSRFRSKTIQLNERAPASDHMDVEVYFDGTR